MTTLPVLEPTFPGYAEMMDLERRPPEPQLPPVVRPSREEAEAAVRTLIALTGDNPARSGLLETPARVVRAYSEFFAGYGADIEAMLARTFDDVEGYDELVVVGGIDFTSHCEHHIVPFSGTCVIGYLPGDRVVGLSKLGRLVDALAQRLQMQERLTKQIADALHTHLAPRGVGVVVRASHTCMTCRGARKPRAVATTSEMRGLMRSEASLRAEFLKLARLRT